LRQYGLLKGFRKEGKKAEKQGERGGGWIERGGRNETMGKLTDPRGGGGLSGTRVFGKTEKKTAGRGASDEEEEEVLLIVSVPPCSGGDGAVKLSLRRQANWGNIKKRIGRLSLSLF